MRSAADAVERKLLAAVERAAKALILEIGRELRRRGTGTPVDTGHARANWIATVGAPNTVEAEGTDTSLAQAGNAIVAAYKLNQGKLYLTNVVRYIRYLNEGSSTQAPALFVENCILRAMVKVKRTLGIDFGVSAIEQEIAEKTSERGARGADNMASAYSPFGDD